MKRESQQKEQRGRSGFLSLLLLLLFVSCGSRSGSTDSNQHIQVTDFRGKTLSLSQPAKRIVCLIESATTGLYMLGAGSQLVGGSTALFAEGVFEYYSRLDERIHTKTLPVPGNWDFVSLESVLSLEPDLVIIWASQQESIQAIENTGIPVYAVMLHSFDDVYKEISDLGILTGRTERANNLISAAKAEVDHVRSLHNDIPQKRSVYFMWAQGMLETSGRNSTVNQLIELAGAMNACPLDEEHVIVNQEQVLEWNPDVIVLWNNTRLNPQDVEDFEPWQSVNAIRNHQVFELPDVFRCDLWTLKFTFAARWLMSHVYPEVHDSVNTEELWQKTYDTYYPQERSEKK